MKKAVGNEPVVKSAGDAGSGELVKVLANRRLSPGGKGQVIVTVEGKQYKVRSDVPMEVSRELADKMREVEVRGIQAVVLA